MPMTNWHSARYVEISQTKASWLGKLELIADTIDGDVAAITDIEKRASEAEVARRNQGRHRRHEPRVDTPGHFCWWRRLLRTNFTGSKLAAWVGAHPK